MNHTPGPWKACRDGACACRMVWSIPGDCPVFTARADAMAQVGLAHHKWGDAPDMLYGEIPLTETEANARLIAATPELLEAANAMCTAIAFTPSDVPGALEFDINAAYNKLRAAIAKAEGVAPANGAETADDTSRDAKE